MNEEIMSLLDRSERVEEMNESTGLQGGTGQDKKEGMGKSRAPSSMNDPFMAANGVNFGF
jgi:hypothetical protein